VWDCTIWVQNCSGMSDGDPRKRKPSPAEGEFLSSTRSGAREECVTAHAGIPPVFAKRQGQLFAGGRPHARGPLATPACSPRDNEKACAGSSSSVSSPACWRRRTIGRSSPRAVRSAHRRRRARRARDPGALRRVPPRAGRDGRRAGPRNPVPVRILVFRNAKGWASPAPLAEGRDRYAIVLAEKGAVPPAVYSELTRLFLKSNTAQMPPAFEHGLAEFFTTFEVNGIHITVGAPPPQAGPTSIGRAYICWWWTPNTPAGCACCSTTCAKASTRTPHTATRSANRRPKSRRRPSAISPKETSRPLRFPAGP
jgi:hypothetical protein